jgi:hypothetical protein
MVCASKVSPGLRVPETVWVANPSEETVRVNAPAGTLTKVNSPSVLVS